jgi:hypothetical protein
LGIHIPDHGYACGCFNQSNYEGSVLLIMKNWNYRVVKRIWNHPYLHEPMELFDICEVSYKENGDIDYISDSLITEESIGDLIKTLHCMSESLDKPILESD